MIKILVVEDSPVLRDLLVHILGSDPEIRVIGTAANGKEALEYLECNKPDVITMDVVMPGMSGFETTKRIMESKPVPIVIVTGSWQRDDVENTFHAIETGAVAAVEKPRGPGHPDHDRLAMELVQTVKLMSEVKVVRRWPRSRKAAPVTTVAGEARQIEKPADIRVVAIGASTGGPAVLQTILSGLSRDFPVPLLIVQHIASGFLEGLTSWLGQTTDLRLCIPAHNEPLLPGHAYFAPDGVHMGVEHRDRIVLSNDEPENGLRPSVSYLFRSVANGFGSNAVGILLTGMGRDGAHELAMMKRKGAITVAQDKESSVVHGMPGEAISLGAAMYVLSPERIAAMLRGYVNQHNHPHVDPGVV